MLFRRLRKRRYYRKQLVPTAHVQAHATIEDGRYVVYFGDKSFFVDIGRTPQEPQVYDFAVFGLAAMSMSNNIEITFSSPVSQSMAVQLERLRRAFDTWTHINIYPLRVNLDDVRPDPDLPARATKGLCLSGGIDSTAAAIEAQRDGFTHGMLIAGADYPDSKDPGFVELRRRVGEQAKIFGFDLLVSETNIKSLNFEWEMLFGLNLAMCLHAQSDVLGTGAIGADFTEAQDLTMHPWGTSHAITDMFGTAGMPMLSLNRHIGRTEKLRLILTEAPDLVNHMSFCWRDTSQGGNCGKCLKCQRTKLNFMAAVGEVPDIFVENPSLMEFARNLQVPERFSGVRTELVQIGNIYQNMPEGELKDAVSKHYFELKEAYALGMPLP
jgi:hypothetical protein